jgi:hypothetical protein
LTGRERLYLDANVAVNDVQPEEEASENDSVFGHHESSRFVKMTQQVVSVIRQTLDVIGESFLHEGETQPRPSSSLRSPTILKEKI